MKLSLLIENVDYSGIPDDVRERLETYQSHLQEWGVREMKNGGEPISVIDAIDYYTAKIGDNRFQNILNNFSRYPKNILSLSLENIKDAQAEYDNTFSRPSKRSLKKSYTRDYVTTIINTNDLKIVRVASKLDSGLSDAAKIASDLARGTKWCVTDHDTAEEYLIDGPLYYITIYGKRYLMHHSSKQFMNAIDRPCKLLRGDNLTETIMQHVADSSEKGEERARMYFERAFTVDQDELSTNVIFTNNKFNYITETILDTVNCAYDVLDYAYNVIGGRWEIGENKVLRDAQYVGSNFHSADSIMDYFDGAIEYSKYVIGDRWLGFEEVFVKYLDSNNIMGNYSTRFLEISRKTRFDYILKYCREIIKGRWLEIEPILLDYFVDTHSQPENVRWLIQQVGYPIPRAQTSILKYITTAIRDKWPEYEVLIGQTLSQYRYDIQFQWSILMNYIELLTELNIKDRRVRAAEEYIYDPRIIYDYAIAINTNNSQPIRLELGEERLLYNDSEEAVSYVLKYAKNIIRTRWPEAERKLLQYPELAAEYAKHVLGRRWPEFEQAMNRILTYNGPINRLQSEQMPASDITTMVIARDVWKDYISWFNE